MKLHFVFVFLLAAMTNCFFLNVMTVSECILYIYIYMRVNESLKPEHYKLCKCGIFYYDSAEENSAVCGNFEESVTYIKLDILYPKPKPKP